MAYLAVSAQAALVVVFVVSAGGKVRDRRHYREFATSLHPLLPAAFRNSVPAVVVAAEITCAVLLLVPPATSLGFAVAAGLLVAFTAGTGWVLATGRTAVCRCFGVGAQRISPVHLVRNLLLLAFTAAGAGAGTVAPGGVLPAVVAGTGVALLMIRLDDVTDLFRPAVVRSD
jgi:hypothetical protein